MIGPISNFNDHEVGFPDTEEQLELFAELIRTRRAWTLKGSYELTARHLIDAGYITPHGEITNRGRVLILDEGREGSPCDANPCLDVVSDDPCPALRGTETLTPSDRGGSAAARR
jgi:hypothetical protein